MVEQTYNLDVIFGSLSDSTRRDMLRRISECSMSVGDVAKYYAISFAGVAKHLSVLERAGLIRKTRKGKEQIVAVDPGGLAAAEYYLSNYKQLWEERLDSLDAFLTSVSEQGKHV